MFKKYEWSMWNVDTGSAYESLIFGFLGFKMKIWKNDQDGRFLIGGDTIFLLFSSPKREQASPEL